MTRTSLFIATLACAAIAAPAALAAPAVTAAWARPAAQGTIGGGYFTLTNAKGPADTLVAVESPVSDMVMMHRSSTSAAGVSTMAMVDAVEAPKGGTVVFAPGGYHLMFTGLKRPLKMGESFPATFRFKSGAQVKATFSVGLAPPKR